MASNQLMNRTRFCRDDRFASDVKIVWNSRKSVSIWSSRSLDKTFCHRDDPYLETSVWKPGLIVQIAGLTKHSATETILTSEMSVWKPGFASIFNTLVPLVLRLILGLWLRLYYKKTQKVSKLSAIFQAFYTRQSWKMESRFSIKSWNSWVVQAGF